MEIRVNPFDLSKDEREAIAGFILTYPGAGKMEAASVVSGPKDPVIIIEDPAAAFRTIEPSGEVGLSKSVIIPAPPAPTPEAINVPNPPAMPSNPISVAGPMLVIPQPEPAAGNAQAGGSLVTLDKVGLPWDERIHASTKTFNADGTWRKKRGIDATTISTVEAELKLLMAIPSPAPVAAAPAIPPPPGSPAVPAAAPDQADLRSQFVALVGRASAALTAGKLTQAEMASACASVGVDSLPKLGIRLDLVPQVAAEIDRLIASHQ
jgi:hypothetical protein